ncbi:Glutaredoxin [uncultured archaeon]|nr:Glutaredoxin [uncultured archaeon]
MVKVFMYTLSTCPWCRKTKQFFRDKNIPFEFVDYDLQSEEEQEKIMEEMSRLGSGSMAFPFVRIGNSIVVGYNPEKYSDLLGLNKGKK